MYPFECNFNKKLERKHPKNIWRNFDGKSADQLQLNVGEVMGYQFDTYCGGGQPGKNNHLLDRKMFT